MSLLGGSLLTLGWLAFVFKQYDQRWYGITEAAVAIGFIAHSCMQNQTVDALPNNWEKLVGAVYFLARGLTNWREAGRKKQPLEGITQQAAAPGLK
jgi:hypothetical protein